MVKKIVAWMIKNQVIEREDEELYYYGICNILFDIVPTMMIVLLASIIHCFLEALLIMLSMRLIRKYSGGYHLKNPYSCCISSIILVVCSSFIANMLAMRESCRWVFFLLGSISYIILFELSPMISSYEFIDMDDVKKYRKITRLMISLQMIIIFIVLSFGLVRVAYAFYMGLIISAGLQIIQYGFFRTKKN